MIITEQRLTIPAQRLAIHCPTRTDIEAVLGVLKEHGFTWKSWGLSNSDDVLNAERIDTMISRYGTEVCINIERKDALQFSPRAYFKHAGDPVIAAADFLKAHTFNLTVKAAACPDCKGKKVYMGLNVIEPCKTCCTS